MTVLSDLRALHERNPVVVDVLVAVGLMPMVVLVPDPDRPGGSSLSGAAAVIAILTCAGLALRHRWPGIVLAGTTLGAAVVIMLAGGASWIVLTTIVALYTFAVLRDRRSAILALAASLATVSAAVTLVTGPWPLDPAAFQYISSFAVATAVGVAVRSRRAFVVAVEERAERADRMREEEAARRVAEERLRIARELHDVVAHRVAIVNVQASVARHLVLVDPPAALAAIEHVREAGRAILDELGDVLNVLRQPDEAVDPHSPAPGLDEVHHLVASFQSLGLAIRQSVSGSPRAVAGGADLVAYRVLQEALTNAHKHGIGQATMTICYEPTEIGLEVTNPVGDDHAAAAVRSADGAGFGLIGMRERVAAVGGEMTARQEPDGHFRVSVRLPDRAGAER
ncbi:sensor histidine kinase [Nocardioides sp. cx-173]|uniref:sensor histidine kinase n=1 Tax=Nocardioides sp. cx-173 TaxID=2898796 RepID=UPI001E56E394|nr:histidine kinase [Nocardioides sp. cx-173]MCD4526647.1 histidine kinase [Nocardioides sp. cx-173]UGB40740.1 histidine kinase [Nocardioides sp. cx-173]